MLVSANVLKWALRFYPPLLFQRIWVVKISKDYRSATIKVNKTLATHNYNRSIFGGTLFSAADPFYPALFHQLLTSRGYKVQLWLRSASIKYVKPAFDDVFFSAGISDAMLTETEQELNSKGRHRQSFEMNMHNREGKLCAIVHGEIYIRNLAFTGKTENIIYESDHE